MSVASAPSPEEISSGELDEALGHKTARCAIAYRHGVERRNIEC